MITEKLQQCPACDSANLRPFKEITDHYFSKERFGLEKCGNCGLVMTQNRPIESEIGKYYDSNNYASHDSGKNQTIFQATYNLARDYMLGLKYQLVRQFKPEMKQVLDYGSGEGFFVEFLQKKGLEAMGIEPSEVARSNFKSRTGSNLIPDIEALNKNSRFQAITMWHVLEHIHKLRPTMETLVGHLEKNGVMAIAVPNLKCLDLAEYGENWAAWDVPRHLYHWDSDSLGAFMQSLGLQQIHHGQLPLDPFYISMISAGYAEKSKVSGIWNGLKSYFHGKSHPKEGSTLMTVWMKK